MQKLPENRTTSRVIATYVLERVQYCLDLWQVEFRRNIHPGRCYDKKLFNGSWNVLVEEKVRSGNRGKKRNGRGKLVDYAMVKRKKEEGRGKKVKSSQSIYA